MSTAEVKARIALDLDADPQAVFAAWVDPSMMERWLFKSPTNTLKAQTDPRAGGAFSIVEHEGSHIITHDGRYAICEAPTRLSFSLAVPQHFAGLAQIDVTIRPRGAGSHLDFQASGAGPPGAQQLWKKMLANLAQVAKAD
ncbi:SRPBCC domain-containing protein [Rhizobium sp. P40RR-XXII]|uniref:SRPBCC family protein n=1 Tax=unclassified Rhizobium TaxID=2613769 RepID=UPI0014567FED|nr:MULTISPECIES: SRPBCC domain-containing protein [unclassified Rhizobium]NLR86446.1 SRPBCC domain-containing protein [Rhizobium sp. P28RR-XV]NLS21342.1 SRPBCC domain-containing protein [Rhizobium sp. P40RR-XXII]